MMCDGPNLKIQKQQNNKNQENKEKNSQSEELQKKRSMMFYQQDSVEPKRPNCECFEFEVKHLQLFLQIYSMSFFSAVSHDEPVESHSLREPDRWILWSWNWWPLVNNNNNNNIYNNKRTQTGQRCWRRLQDPETSGAKDLQTDRKHLTNQI